MIKCFRPVRLINNGSQITVPCGKCPSCLNSKGSYNTSMIDCEEKESFWSFFGTLTYDNDSLPVARVTEQDGTLYFNPLNERILMDTGGASLFEVPLSDLSILDPCFDLISRKQKRPRYDIPFIYVRDYQLFYKRFKITLERTYGIDSDTIQAIRYFYCSEYGTKRFRPHFHFILFVRESERFRITPECLRKAVLSSWTYGRVDFQRSKGKNSSYLGQYLNGNSRLPRIYQLHDLRQRCRHSNYFAESFFKEIPQAFAQGEFEKFFEPAYYLTNNRVHTFSAPKSYFSRLFPKIYRYSELLPYEFAVPYLSYQSALGEVCPKWYSVETLAQIIYEKGTRSYTYCSLLKVYRTVCISLETLRGIFQCSRRFLNLCERGAYSPYDYIDIIRRFYDFKARNSLRQFYQSQVDFISSYVNTRSDLFFLTNWYEDFSMKDDSHHLVSDECDSLQTRFLISLFGDYLDSPELDEFDYGKYSYKNNPFYQKYCFDQQELFENRIKHKKDAVPRNECYFVE